MNMLHKYATFLQDFSEGHCSAILRTELRKKNRERIKSP